MSVAKQVFAVFTIVFALEAAPTAGAQPTGAEASVLQAVNEVRARHGLRRLAVDRRLELAARSHSRALIRRGTLAHGDVRRRLASAGARGRVFGENLAWGVGSRAAATAVVRAWLASPPHRANLLRPSFRRIGIGRVTGTFAGYGGAAVVTADFAG